MAVMVKIGATNNQRNRASKTINRENGRGRHRGNEKRKMIKPTTVGRDSHGIGFNWARSMKTFWAGKAIVGSLLRYEMIQQKGALPRDLTRSIREENDGTEWRLDTTSIGQAVS
jgi:hypothetical protein